MTHETLSPAIGAIEHYRALVEAMPGNCLLMLADSPKFTILAANPDYLATSGYTEETLLGRGVFEAFPGNPADPKDEGAKALMASFQQVLHHKQSHVLPVQRYDIQQPDGSYLKKHWRAVNKPVFSRDREIVFILHVVEDISEVVKATETNRKLEAEVNEIDKEKRKAQRSEEELRGMIAQAPIGICIMDADTLISQIVNDKFLEIAGRPLNEVIGWMYWDTFAEARSYYEEDLKDVVQNGVPFFASEVPVPLLRHGKKETVHVTFVYEPLKNTDGAVEKVVVWVLDNTPQVVARQKVAESEALFRTMAEGTPVLIAVGNESSNATYFNKAWTELTGRPMEELVDFGWVDLVHPEDKNRYVNLYLDAFAAKRPFTGEFRVLNPEGKYRWLLAHGVPRYTTGGAFLGYVSACTDITEHKIAEQQLQTALEQVRLSKEAAELGTFDMDLQKGLLDWDDRCRTLFGISHHNPVTYEKDFAQGLHPDDRERILKIIEQLFNKSISNGNYDVEYRTVGAEDGVIRWVRAKGKVYFDAQDTPTRFIGSVLDITEKVTAIQKIEGLVEERTRELAQANEALQSINNALKRSNRNLEEFAHAASHDLKEPVRKVHFFTQQLKQQLSAEVKEEQLRLFERIQNATDRMRNLIDDLLLYSHVSQRPHEMEAVDLNNSLQQVLVDLELDISEKKAVVHADQLPVVKGYNRQLQQLLQNLVSNALKYSRQDVAPDVQISSQKTIENGQPYYVIRVKDNGIGFEQEYSEQIFQMFTRLHGRSEYSGTGIGLSIVKKVVDNHQGRIQVESAPEKGAAFSIYLPAD